METSNVCGLNPPVQMLSNQNQNGGIIRLGQRSDPLRSVELAMSLGVQRHALAELPPLVLIASENIPREKPGTT